MRQFLCLTNRLITLKIVQKSTRSGECNLTLSLCDVPLLAKKEREVSAMPKQGEVKDKALRLR
jgi:hypothetical protein